jgi:hypothetical protein
MTGAGALGAEAVGAGSTGAWLTSFATCSKQASFSLASSICWHCAKRSETVFAEAAMAAIADPIEISSSFFTPITV